jgi:hypothetical protein
MGHVTCMSEVKSVYRILVVYLKQTSRLGGGCSRYGLHLRTSDYGMERYGTVWYGTVRYGTVRYDTFNKRRRMN